MSNDLKDIPAEELERIDQEAAKKYPNWYTEYNEGRAFDGYIKGARSEYLRHLSRSETALGPRWVKASNQKPADGLDGQILHIKPVKILLSHAYKIYNALIYMGKHDGGLAWHWYEGSSSGWHTKIALEDWDKIEYLDESIPSSEPAKESQPIGNGISLIAMERREQIEKHGRTVEKDIELNGRYQITHAARMLAWAPDEEGFDLMRDGPFIPEGWSKEIWHKMMDKSYRQRLVIAGALIAAELDRLTYDGQSSPQPEPSEDRKETQIPTT